MTSRRLYFGVCIVLPLFTLFFMATIFGNGQMENIPIGIVDQDNTATSRAIARNISAVPTFKVTKHFGKAAILLALQNPADSTEKPDRKAEERQNNQLKYI